MGKKEIERNGTGGTDEQEVKKNEHGMHTLAACFIIMTEVTFFYNCQSGVTTRHTQICISLHTYIQSPYI